ncbi:MAG: hypothetical protein HQL69_17405 [Magnetococcales bacterium]|nr:hypothetical protein [Magnetococcales bacterium]
MKATIPSLLEEHQQILNLLEDVEAGGINTEKGQSDFIRVRDTILAHKESSKFIFESLKVDTKQGQKLNRIATSYLENCKMVTDFVEKFSANVLREGKSRDFSSGFHHVKHLIKHRIHIEGALLHKCKEIVATQELGF